MESGQRCWAGLAGSVNGGRAMRRITFVLTILTVAVFTAPVALAEPVPPIDWCHFVDEVVDPDFDVGEEAC